MHKKFLGISLIFLSNFCFSIGEWGAEGDQIKNAHCKGFVPSATQMEKELTFEANKFPLINMQVGPVKFMHQNPALMEHFVDLVTNRHLKYDKRDDVLNEKVLKLAKGCNNILCAVKTIFGQKNGIKILWLKLKRHFNASHYAFENSSPLKESDLNIILQAALDYPDHVLPFINESNHQLTHFLRGKTYGVYSEAQVYANAEIFLFDNWDDLATDETKQYAIYHEIAHAVATQLQLSENEKWLKISKCENESSSSCYVSEYAETNPSEDLAESISSFRYNPLELKKASLKKYNFVKEVIYRGLEYTSSQTCRNENSVTDFKLAKKILSNIPNFNAAKMETSLMHGCDNLLLEILQGEGIFNSKLSFCVRKNIINSQLEGVLSENQLVLQSIKETNGLKLIANHLFKQDVQNEFSNIISQEVTKLKTSLKQDLLHDLTSHDLHWRRLNSKNTFRDDSDFCESWSRGERYANQVVKEYFLNNTCSSSFAHQHRTEIYSALKNLCLRMTEERGFPWKDIVNVYLKLKNPFTEYEILKALKI